MVDSGKKNQKLEFGFRISISPEIRSSYFPLDFGCMEEEPAETQCISGNFAERGGSKIRCHRAKFGGSHSHGQGACKGQGGETGGRQRLLIAGFGDGFCSV